MTTVTDQTTQQNAGCLKDTWKEDQYWKDFFWGNALEKYGEIKIVQEWTVDKNIVSFEIHGQ